MWGRVTDTPTCPSCESNDTRLLAKKGLWLCLDCEEEWADNPAEQTPPSASTGIAVFISYGHADASAFANRLRADLEESGCSPVWLDSEMITGGDCWTASIEQGIREAHALLAIMTPHSLRETSVCQDEVALAVAENKRVVPLRIDLDSQLRPSLLLVRRSWVDFTGDYDEALSRLKRALAGDESALGHPLSTVSGQRPLAFDVEIAKLVAGFTGREWLLSRLDEWLLGNRGRAFVIEGEPGIGKSAIAARLTAREDCAAVHFCTTRNADTLKPLAFVANLVVALCARVPGFAEQIALRHPEEVRDNDVTAFRQLVIEPAHALASTPTRPQIIVVDALDEAASREGETIVDLIAAHAASLPSWLRIVATTRPEADVVARMAAFDPITLDAASCNNLEDVAAYITTRLAATALSERISDCESVAHRLAGLASGNFLYAEKVLDSLEAPGGLTEADLDELPRELSGLYHEMFRRAFRDFETYSRDFVPLLRCIAAAFAPIPREVLLKATGLDPEILNRRLNILAPFLREDRQGGEARYSFYHRSFADWLTSVERVYSVDVYAGHEQLAEALEDPLSSDYALRWLPRHLVALERWDDLAGLLANLAYLEAAWNLDKDEVLRLWATVEGSSPLRIAETYRDVVLSPIGRHGEFALARLLHATGHLEEASALYARRIEVHRGTGDRRRLQACLGYLAAILRARGDLDGAMAMLEEQQCICRELGYVTGLSHSLGNQALILKARGDVDGAMALLKEQERSFRELGDPGGLAYSLGNQALILKARGELDEAMALFEEQERICLELGDPVGLAYARGNQATILQDRGDPDGAIVLMKEQERVFRELGDPAGLAYSLGNQAPILRAKGDLNGAMMLLKEQERICRELGNPTNLAHSLGNQAFILQDRRDFEGALALLRDVERTCRELGHPEGLGIVLCSEAECLIEMGHPTDALEPMVESVEIGRTLRSPALNGRLKLLERVRATVRELPDA